jgi:hypothetical protein
MVAAEGGGVVFQSAIQVMNCDITLALPVRIHSPAMLDFLVYAASQTAKE